MPSVQEIQNTLAGINSRFSTTGAGAQDRATQEMANYVRSNGLDPNMVAQAAAGLTGGNWDANRVQQTLAQYNPTQYGLAGAQNTLNQGANTATNQINNTQQKVGDMYSQGFGFLSPFMQRGNEAGNMQAALSGAMGPEAQKRAFADYQASPGVAFAQSEAERALMRNSAATGGSLGGNVLRDLTQLAAGTAMQDFGNQFNRLGQVADRGYGAATTSSGLAGQQAQVQAGLGQYASGIPMQAANNLSSYQFQAGRDIGSAVSDTTSALASLINQQGAGMADITGNSTNNISALYQNALNGDANAKEQLAAMLANLSTNSASQVGGLPLIEQTPSNLVGQLGQVAGGVGGLASGLSYMQNNVQPAPSAPVYGPSSVYNTNPGYGPSYTGIHDPKQYGLGY